MGDNAMDVDETSSALFGNCAAKDASLKHHPASLTSQNSIQRQLNIMPVRDLMRSFLNGTEGNIIGKYKRGQKLGEGTYGVVYKATDENNNPYALKKIRLDHDDQQGVPATTIREVVALQELAHPNIVKLLATHLQAGSLWLVFEYLNYDLRRYLEQEYTNRNRTMEESAIQKFFYQILLGMDFMHKRRYLHRDLKPQNILVKDDGVVKLADFGLARLVGCPVRILTHEIVTLYYRSPEVLLGNHDTPYGPGVDIWSLGCIFGEMYKLEPLFEGDSEIDQLYQIFRVLSTPTETNWPGITSYPCYQQIFPVWTQYKLDEVLPPHMGAEARDLLRQMLFYFPTNRIQCSDALLHPFFNGLRENMPVILQHQQNAEINGTVKNNDANGICALANGFLRAKHYSSARNAAICTVGVLRKDRLIDLVSICMQNFDICLFCSLMLLSTQNSQFCACFESSLCV